MRTLSKTTIFVATAFCMLSQSACTYTVLRYDTKLYQETVEEPVTKEEPAVIVALDFKSCNACESIQAQALVHNWLKSNTKFPTVSNQLNATLAIAGTIIETKGEAKRYRLFLNMIRTDSHLIVFHGEYKGQELEAVLKTGLEAMFKDEAIASLKTIKTTTIKTKQVTKTKKIPRKEEAIDGLKTGLLIGVAAVVGLVALVLVN